MNIFFKYWRHIAILLILIILLHTTTKANTIKVNLTDSKTIKVIAGAQVMRNDAQGKGNYGSIRNGHIHQGVDILITPKEPIFAPFNGKIRQANPYANDSNYTGLEISATSGNMKVKMFYVNKFVAGATFNKGDIIAYAQDISQKYGGGMLPHVHLELRINNLIQDPTKYIF